ncbi:MAG: hypothetical protein H0T79_15255 [Deltaproteobacteria bacterium]|nr:hypothetical protein [Deltaproteobacteria bacterium]
MNKLILATITAAVTSQTAGCIITTSGEDASITARWDLQNFNGQRTACPAGYQTAALNSQLLDRDGRPVGDPAIDLFDCQASYGVTAPLEAELYQVWLEIRSDEGSQLYAQSTSAIVNLYDADQTFDASILNDGGYFMLDWNLVGARTNQPLSCTDIVGGIDSISTISTAIASNVGAFDDQFHCEGHYGLTAGLLQGDYTISINAEQRGQSIGTAPAITERILDRNQVTDLGSITIPIEGL